MDASKKIVRYSLPVPTAAPFIGFAIGPFEMIKLTPSQLQDELLIDADLDENQQQCLLAEINMMSNIYAFALPGQKDALINTCTFLMHVSIVQRQSSKLVLTSQRLCIFMARSMALIHSTITRSFSLKMHGAIYQL